MSGNDTKKTTQLSQKVNRWEGHMSDKHDSVKRLPASLDMLTGTGISEEPAKRRKTIQPKPEDDRTTQACIAIANHHSILSNNDAVKLPSVAEKPSESALRSNRGQHRIEIRTNLDPIEQLRKDIALEKNLPEQDNRQSEKTISGATFGLEQLENVFDSSRRYWNSRTSKKMDEGIEAYQKEEVSRFHIKKMLWIYDESRPFKRCIMAEQGFCRAQVEEALSHPMAEKQPCIAYYTPREYDAIINGVKAEEVADKHEFCEFCYRYQVELEVERVKHNSHRSESEIPHRYYKAQIPGEYSVAGMHQPVEKKTTHYPDGIVGHMRKFNISDFVPVVALLDGQEPGETFHVDAYRRKCELGEIDDTHPVLYGWEETKPIHRLNDNAFFEVNQIDPYERVTIDTAEELTVASLLRDHFVRRAITPNMNFSHIFQDLMECVQDPTWLQLPHAYTGVPEKDRWKRFCLHDTSEPFDYAAHQIYHVLLIKINTCKEISYNGKPIAVNDAVKQKLNKFVSAHHALADWMSKTKILSDAEILGISEYDTELGLDVPLLFARYPRDTYHYRDRDCDMIQLRTTIRRRDNPMEICKRYYCNSVEERLSAPLIQLPHKFEPPQPTGDGFIPNAYLTRTKQQFAENAAQLTSYELSFQWTQPDVALLRRRVMDSDSGDRSDAEIQEQAFALATEQLQSDFLSVSHTADRSNELYQLMISKFAHKVFCSFDETVIWLTYRNDIPDIVQAANCFVSLLPCNGLGIDTTPTTVNGNSWMKHCVMLACLLRCFVAEELHKLEPPSKTKLRYNLVLFRDSHISLFRKITENLPVLLTDVDLTMFRGIQKSNILDQFYPFPTREVHQGSLPDYVDSLTKVNFISDGAMDEYPWIKMQFKKPDRCCDGREFHEMLRTLCMKDDTFYHYTCLELELSFKGHYEHCTVVPRFARAVLIDELFDNVDDHEVKESIFRLIVDNQDMIAEATSESLCYMLEHAAPLRDVVREVYRDWFAWRAKANMDMVRRCFDDDGNFSRVTSIVYDRVRLHSSKTIYRHVETDFVVWLCGHMKKFNEHRYKQQPMQKYTQPEHMLDYDERLIINSVIYYLSPTQSIDATDLEIVGLEPRTIDVLYELYEIFRFHVNKNLGISETDTYAPNTNVILHLETLSPQQYNVMRFFFQSLQRYQTIRTMKLNNLTLLKKQHDALLQKHNVKTLGELDTNTTKFYFSTCCLSVKNTFSREPDMFAMGTEEVMYVPPDDTYNCAKKEQRSGKRKASSRGIGAKAALKNEDLLMRPVCGDTEIIAIDALGEMIDTDGCKIVRSKKPPANNRKVFVPPLSSPYWITPCCGTLFGYRYDRWYPGGYACGLCSNNNKLAATFNSLFCVCCRIPVQPNKYTIVKTYDDVFAHSYSRTVICHRCKQNWRLYDIEVLPVSLLMKGSTDREWCSTFTHKIN